MKCDRCGKELVSRGKPKSGMVEFSLPYQRRQTPQPGVLCRGCWEGGWYYTFNGQLAWRPLLTAEMMEVLRSGGVIRIK